MKCQVRLARDVDAAAISAAIVETLRESNSKDYSPDIIHQVAQNFSPGAIEELMSRRLVFVAETQSMIIGTASLEGETIRTVFVVPHAQRQGVGTLLVAEVERAARNSGLRTLTVPSSVTAEGFYAKLGFKAVRDAYYGEERTIIMERTLAPP